MAGRGDGVHRHGLRLRPEPHRRIVLVARGLGRLRRALPGAGWGFPGGCGQQAACPATPAAWHTGRHLAARRRPALPRTGARLGWWRRRHLSELRLHDRVRGRAADPLSTGPDLHRRDDRLLHPE